MGTTLYDSIYLACDEVIKKQQGRKALILLTDGVDHGSKYTLSMAIESAQRADTMVYSVLFADPHGYGNNNGPMMGGPGMGRRRGMGYPGGGYPGGGYPGGGYPNGGNGRRRERQEGAAADRQRDGRALLRSYQEGAARQDIRRDRRRVAQSIQHRIHVRLRRPMPGGLYRKIAGDRSQDRRPTWCGRATGITQAKGYPIIVECCISTSSPLELPAAKRRVCFAKKASRSKRPISTRDSLSRNWIGLIGERDYKTFLNSRNELYRERGMKDNPPPRAEALRLMSENPNLIKRPILISGNRGLFWVSMRPRLRI